MQGTKIESESVCDKSDDIFERLILASGLIRKSAIF